MWFPPETEDPVLLHFPTRRSAGFLGTVGLRDGTFFSHRERENQWRHLLCLSESP
jgi:hypothetical protein